MKTIQSFICAILYGPHCRQYQVLLVKILVRQRMFPTDALDMVANILIKEHAEVTRFRQDFKAFMHSLYRRVRN